MSAPDVSRGTSRARRPRQRPTAGPPIPPPGAARVLLSAELRALVTRLYGGDAIERLEVAAAGLLAERAAAGLPPIEFDLESGLAESIARRREEIAHHAHVA